MKSWILMPSLLLSLSVQGETLPEVVRQTLQSNPDVLISVNNKAAVEQEGQRARAGYLPSLDLSLGYGREYSENTTTRATAGSQGLGLERSEAGLTLTQMLFDGFSTQSDIARQQARLESAGLRVEDTRQNTALRAIESFLEVLRRQELVELAKDNLVVYQKTVKQIKLLLDSGAGRKADLQQAEARLALATANLVSAQGDLRNAEATYLRVTGTLPKQLQAPDMQSVRSALPPDLDQALTLALENHPATHIALADLSAAQAAHAQSRGAYMPQVDLELGITRNRNLDGVSGANNDSTAMLRMRYNLYRGGADQARRAETAAYLDSARETVNRTRRLLEEQVRLAWSALATARDRLAYLQIHRDNSGNVLKSYKQQFQMGQRTLLDVLDSESELYNARAALLSAEYAERLGLFRVLAGIGKLLENLGVPYPN